MNIYIHVPFCRKKCDYCAFYSEAVPEGSSLADRWLDKLERDITNACVTEKVHTLYLGGGTPTYLSPAQMKRLYGFLRRTFSFTADAEITSECNPGTLNEEKAEILAGFVNRVSMGVQSFDPEKLRMLGRGAGTPDEAVKTVSLLRKAGIQNLGLDLIADLPGEGPEELKCDLESALSLEPDHLSVYSLILEPETPLGKRLSQTKLPDDSISAENWLMAGEFLRANGLPRYEVSNYASKPFRCKHNWNVWHGEPYLAFGPSACSFDGKLRKTEIPSIVQWLNGIPAIEDPLPKEKRLREIFIMGLRTVDGWDRHGLYDWDFLLPELKKMPELISITADFIFPTERGLLFWDTLAEDLI